MKSQSKISCIYSRLFLIIVSLIISCPCADSQRPIYIIGNLVNSIDESFLFLEAGANALELDICFYKNGTVNQVRNVFIPCECGRNCYGSSDLSNYLTYVRTLTSNRSFANKPKDLAFLHFDLQLYNVEEKQRAGSSLAEHIIKDLWGSPNVTAKDNFVKTVVNINYDFNKDAIVGFEETFSKFGLSSFLDKYVGFDGGYATLRSINYDFYKLNVSNIWLGDGITNCKSERFPDTRLRTALQWRDLGRGSVCPAKVYHRIIDSERRVRESLRLEVDGFLTNTPSIIEKILKEEEFRDCYRIASMEDNPFERYLNEKSCPSSMDQKEETVQIKRVTSETGLILTTETGFMNWNVSFHSSAFANYELNYVILSYLVVFLSSLLINSFILYF